MPTSSVVYSVFEKPFPSWSILHFLITQFVPTFRQRPTCQQQHVNLPAKISVRREICFELCQDRFAKTTGRSSYNKSLAKDQRSKRSRCSQLWVRPSFYWPRRKYRRVQVCDQVVRRNGTSELVETEKIIWGWIFIIKMY